MKSKIAILAVLFLSVTLSLYAQSVRTVSNHPLDGAQYSSLQSAYDAAVNGDTLLIEGTGSNYQITGCNQNWSKSLIVIGSGFNTQKQNFFRTRIIATVCNLSFLITASNASFYGIHFVNPVIFNTTLSDVLFENCQFDNILNFNNNACTGIVVRNCIFNNDNSDNIYFPSFAAYSITLYNCVFDGMIRGQSNIYGIALIDHCLFLRTNAESIMDLKNSSTISNSIFMNFASIANSNTTGCFFINNISRLATSFPPAGNSGSGNLNSTNPNFVNYTLGTLYATTQDYHLQAGSAAIGAGSDATDIGVHGGSSKFSEYGEPLNAPVMRSMQINNTTVAPNGILNVDITASKPNDN